MAATVMTSAAGPVSLQAGQASVPFPLVGRPGVTVPGAPASAIMAAAGIPASIREASLGATNVGGMPPPSVGAPLNGGGTLKSAHVVPLPGEPGPVSRPFTVAIAKPPPLWKQKTNVLAAAIGGACLLLGIGLTVTLCSGDDEKRPRGANPAFKVPPASSQDQGAAADPSGARDTNSPSPSSNNASDKSSSNDNRNNDARDRNSNDRSNNDRGNSERGNSDHGDHGGDRGGGKGNKGGGGKGKGKGH
jgi:hypothetical protein